MTDKAGDWTIESSVSCRFKMVVDGFVDLIVREICCLIRVSSFMMVQLATGDDNQQQKLLRSLCHLRHGTVEFLIVAAGGLIRYWEVLIVCWYRSTIRHYYWLINMTWVFN